MERFKSNVSSLQAALQEAPEVLYALRVNLTANIFFEMINRVVNEVLFRKVVVALHRIGVHRGLLFDVREDFILQRLALYIGNPPLL